MCQDDPSQDDKPLKLTGTPENVARGLEIVRDLLAEKDPHLALAVKDDPVLPREIGPDGEQWGPPASTDIVSNLEAYTSKSEV